jgi:hypothetical protein
MADRLENEVRYFLRSSEDVTVTLETLIVGKRAEEDNEKNRRVLAVVTHQNDTREEEEGRCVVYCPIVDCSFRIVYRRLVPLPMCRQI